MSDDVNNAKDFVSANFSWLIAVFSGAWAMGLRLMIGRHYKAVDAVQERLSEIEKSIANIEGRLTERDNRGSYTWPPDRR